MTDMTAQDRLGVQELSARYAFLVDTKRYTEVGALFAEDGSWDETVIGIPRCGSRAEIETFFPSMSAADLEFLIHINGNHQIIECDGDIAKGTVHLHAAGRWNATDILVYGYYDDVYVRRDGRWLFQSRKLVTIAPAQGDFTTPPQDESRVDSAAAAAG